MATLACCAVIDQVGDHVGEVFAESFRGVHGSGEKVVRTKTKVRGYAEAATGPLENES